VMGFAEAGAIRKGIVVVLTMRAMAW
jgi:hypothetical protein